MATGLVIVPPRGCPRRQLRPRDLAALWAGPGRQARGRVASAQRRLVRALGAPQRRYHGARHIAQTLAIVERLEQAGVLRLPALRRRVRLALWAHDAVYRPLAADNEAASADLLRRLARGGCGPSPALVRQVAALILATRDHLPGPDPAAAAVLDADLAVLGLQRPAYARYTRAVRQEYRAVPDPLWRQGRARVLAQLLARPQIFRLAWMRHRLEPRARANLSAERAALLSP